MVPQGGRMYVSLLHNINDHAQLGHYFICGQSDDKSQPSSPVQ